MDHKHLEAWRQAMLLVEQVYKASARFPTHEVYGLISQMRRAAVSVPSNLSEGAGRNGSREYINFLGISLGSLAELETQSIIASRLGYADTADILNSINQVRALLIGLRNHLKSSIR
jgi:four helix bundle protein